MNNATLHFRAASAGWSGQFHAALQSDGWNFALKNQPSQSPDLNVLDLCFFNSLQSIQQQYNIASLDYGTSVLREIFDAYDDEKLDNSFITLQSVMNEILKVKGAMTTD